MAYFSYPSITTKRFIHSLGTMHLSSFMFKNALLNADKKTENDFLSSLKKVIISIKVVSNFVRFGVDNTCLDLFYVKWFQINNYSSLLTNLIRKLCFK